MNLTAVDVGKVLAGGVLGVSVGSSIEKFKEIAVKSMKVGTNETLVRKAIGVAQLGVGGLALYYGIKFETNTFWKYLNVALGLSQIYYGGKTLLGK